MTLRPSDLKVRFIWATRGRTWGFRFLRDGGFEDPLGVYDAAFSELGDQPEVWRRVADRVALRFPDPDARRDAAGRVIPHDFVLLGSWANDLDSLDEGRRRIWHEVASEFENVWNRAEPPAARA